jgi:hypothetical protein
MPSSYSASLRFELQFTGENVNTYGIKLDNTFARMDDAIAGYVAITVTGNYTLQVSNDNTSSDEARRAHLKFVGAPASPFTITIPSVSKSYWIWNGTGVVATITTGSGDTVGIDPGDRLQVFCDGMNVETTNFGGLPLKSFIAASVLAATGTLPSLTGNAGKFIYTDGVNALWKAPASTDLSDYQTKILGVQVALAVSL